MLHDVIRSSEQTAIVVVYLIIVVGGSYYTLDGIRTSIDAELFRV